MVLILNHGLTVATTSSDDTLSNSEYLWCIFKLRQRSNSSLMGHCLKDLLKLLVNEDEVC